MDDTPAPLSHAEGFHEGINSSAHLVVLLVWCILSGTIILGSIIWIAIGRRMKMSSIMFVFAWTSVTSVAIITWLVTHNTVKEGMEEEMRRSMTATANEVELLVRKDLTVGVQLSLLVAELQSHSFDMYAPFPSPHEFLAKLVHSIGAASSSMGLLYYATSNGTVNGVMYQPTSDQYSLLVGFPTSSDSKVRCIPTACRSPVFMDGSSSACTCPCGEKCIPSSGAQRTRSLCPDSCASGCSAACPSTPAFGVVPTDRKRGEFHLGLETPVQTTPFDPKETTMYTNGGQGITWGNPQWWPGVTSSQGSLFITASHGMYEGDEKIGVVAVDFIMKWVSDEMIRIKPTPNSAMLLVQDPGYVIAGSYSQQILVQRENNRPVMYDAMNHNHAEVRDIVISVVNSFGSMEEAFKLSAITQHDERDEVILSRPLLIEGSLSLLLIISIPHDDILGKINNAWEEAFVTASIISMLISLLFFVFCKTITRPLKHLAQDMNDAAWMRIDAVPVRSSGIVYEVAWMMASFHLMVNTLSNFKPFLSQAVLQAQANALQENRQLTQDEINAATGEANETTSDTPAAAVAVDVEDEIAAAAQRDVRPILRRASLHRHHSNQLAPNCTQSVATLSAFSVDHLLAKNIAIVYFNYLHFHKCLAEEMVSAASAPVGNNILSVSINNQPATTAGTQPREQIGKKIVAAHQEYLQTCMDEASKSDGIVEKVMGDKVMVSFNASKKCGQHTSHALHCAVKVCNDMDKTVNCGVSSGKGYTGNLGTPSLRERSVISHSVPTAATLERLGARHEVAVLGDENVCRTNGLDFKIKIHQRIIQSTNSQPLIVLQVFSEVNHIQNPSSWMYSSPPDSSDQQLITSGEFQSFNNAIQYLWSGKYQNALEQLKDSTDAMHTELASMIRDAQKANNRDCLTLALTH
eukprot:TRINITY_DN8064_c0_g1_i1.p1 TRINITY_DN8064_c0_g1~~TRINITY_DN8064_c0_g1_i1.p1  ORF type:complete len:919 (+),score=139.96 TRINITY_DN8064_c0_g1_i1:1978-4734(+)